MAPSQLIVGGWPDAAAHEVALVLNEHPHVLLGFERYAKALSVLDAHHLGPRHVLDPLPQETDVRGERLYDRLRPRVGNDALAYIGDVVPGYAQMLDELADRLSGARFVIALGRQPSDDAGRLEAWRRVVRIIRASDRRPYGARVFVLSWQRCIEGGEPWLTALLTFLELPGSPRLAAEWTRVTRISDAAAPAPLAASVAAEDAELEGWLSRRAVAELERLSTRQPPVDLDDPPLTDDDLRARETERAELLEQRRGQPGAWPDELDALRRRHRSDALAIARRGRRLRERGLTAVSGLPDRGFQVTIVNPYDRTEVIAANAIDQLAAQLDRLVTVRLLARGRPSIQRFWNAEVVVSESMDFDMLGGAPDAVIAPADQAVVQRLRDGTGDEKRLVLLLADPAGLEVVAANPGCEVITPAGSLARAARAAGARALRIPLGVSPSVGAQPTPMDARGLIVTAQSRVGSRHSAEDLQTALVAVRELRPDAEIVVFGAVPVDGATQFHLYPQFGPLLEILRASAVHVASARESAVGAVGALSLAAGSALVSTATDGAAEYAVPDVTAILTRAGDPDALAAGVISLLDDLPLRARIADEGRRYIEQLLPRWQEVARRVAVMLIGAR